MYLALISLQGVCVEHCVDTHSSLYFCINKHLGSSSFLVFKLMPLSLYTVLHLCRN